MQGCIMQKGKTDIRPSGRSAGSCLRACEPHEVHACSLLPPNCSFLYLPFFGIHTKAKQQKQKQKQWMWGKFKAKMEDWLSYEEVCVCVCSGAEEGMFMCIPWRVKDYTELIHTLNSISEPSLWCMNQSAVKGYGAEYGPLLIGLSHDREGCMPPSDGLKQKQIIVYSIQA